MKVLYDNETSLMEFSLHPYIRRAGKRGPIDEYRRATAIIKKLQDASIDVDINRNKI